MKSFLQTFTAQVSSRPVDIKKGPISVSLANGVRRYRPRGRCSLSYLLAESVGGSPVWFLRTFYM